MACITTYTGIHMDPTKPQLDDICLVDIAHSLSLLCRANGHFRYFYSIAQHSINCANEAKARNLSKKMQLACLLHDASEAYISDITRPIKANLPEYLTIEKRLQKIIYEKFGLKNVDYAVVEEIDNALLYMEFQIIMGEKVYDTPPETVSTADCSEKDYNAVKNIFLRLAENLINEKPVMTALGIDGCKFGWCVVKLDCLGNCSMKLVEKIEEIMSIQADIAIIDIPIGMIDPGGKERTCDTEARKILKKKHSSVFPVPCRKAVYANSFEEACKINKEITNRNINHMSWGIVLKFAKLMNF